MQRDPRTRGKAGTSVAIPAGAGATRGGGGGEPDPESGDGEGIAHTLTAHHGRNSGEDVFALSLSPDASAESPAHAIRTTGRVGNCEDTFALAPDDDDEQPARCHTARRGRDGASSDQTFALGFHCTQDPTSAEEKTPSISAESSGCIGVLPIQSAERGGLRKQNGIGVGEVGDPMYTITSRGDHAVFPMQGGRAMRGKIDGIGDDGDPMFSLTGRADAAVFAFDEVQITSPDNRSTVPPGAPVPTVSKTSRLSVAGGLVPRRLTPLEVERCFGFPDNYTLVEGSSDSARYEALGNTMQVPVMRWIGQRILMVEEIVRKAGR